MPLRLILFTALCLPIFGQAQAPLTDQRVIELSKSGVTESELERVIATAPEVDFILTPAAEDEMLKAGVTEPVIKAMAARLYGRAAISGSPIASTPTVSKRNHKVRNWIIIGSIAAAGAAVGGYYASNPKGAGGLQNGPHF